jgi:MFS family permease
VRLDSESASQAPCKTPVFGVTIKKHLVVTEIDMVMEAHPDRMPWPTDIRRLLWMQGLMNASHFMTIPLLALYMSANLHFSAAALASVMSANLLCAQALPLAAGAVADRFGSHRLITLGLLLRGLGFLGFSYLDGPVAWVGCAAIAGTGVACYEGGVYGLFGRQPKASPLSPIRF